MSSPWEGQRERSTPLMLNTIVWIAHNLGRGVARLILLPIVAYFLVTGGQSLRASRDFLRRVLPREPTWLDVARHLHCFASCALDKVFLLGDKAHRLRVEVHNPEVVLDVARRGSGCLLLVSHIGSFEAIRVPGTAVYHLPLRILMDREHGRMMTAVLDTLNPTLAAGIIDASQRGPQLVLALKQALDQGSMVGMMADRARADEPAAEVRFLDGIVRMPVGPWMLASALGVPVILAFALYRGGACYDAHFELFSERLQLPRPDRAAAVQACAQRYALRLEHYVRQAPYNWFNFYDYWQSNSEPEPAGRRPHAQ